MSKQIEERLIAVNEIFSPSAPIESISLFVGRIEQITKVKEAIEERGQHIVTFGTRGVGKTSLANVVRDLFKNVSTVKVTCNRNDDFRSIWDRAFSKTKFIISERNVGFNASVKDQVIRLYLPEKEDITAHDIESVLSDVYNTMLIVFDEFDSISDEKTKIKMADTLKSLSDNIFNITVMIIGIADSVDELLGHHLSLERCIKQIHMPLMSADESYQIIDNNLPLVGLKIEKDVADRIVEYASGFPHYVHLLCKYSSQMAITEGRNTIKHEHLNWAVDESINNSNQSIKTAYQLAVKSNSRKKNQFEDVIYACSLIENNDRLFSSEDVIQIYNKLTSSENKPETINYNLGMLCKEERGEILVKAEKVGEQKYTFKNPLMKAFVKLKIHSESNEV